jgi:hypothetical protein
MPKIRVQSKDEQPEKDQSPAATSTEDAQDVEGHNLWMNPSASREMTNSRSRDLEREARDRQRAKEAKGDKR